MLMGCFRQTITLSPEGDPQRTTNVRDGYAINMAIKTGSRLPLLQAGTPIDKVRYQALGVKHIYLKSKIKMIDFRDYIEKQGTCPKKLCISVTISPIMKSCSWWIARCTRRCCPEIKQIAKYISKEKGGEGVVRDVIEQVLKVQGKWLNGEAFGW